MYIYSYAEDLVALLFQYMRYRGRPQRPLPFTADAQNGTLGEASFHTHSTATSSHEEAAVQV